MKPRRLFMKLTRRAPGSWPALQLWCEHQFKRWSLAMGGIVLGFVGVMWVAIDLGAEYEQVQQAVDAAALRLQKLPAPSLSVPSRDPHPASALQARLTVGVPADTWTDVQHALQVHGVQVVSLRVLPQAMGGPLHSQAVALRLQAPFEQWLQAWVALAEAGPVVSLDRMGVTPMEASQGVQLDVVMRLWFKPGSEVSQATVAWSLDELKSAGSGLRAGAHAEVFVPVVRTQLPPVLPQSAVAAPERASDETALPAHPSLWPISRVRLLGTWQQGVQWQAVLGAAQAWAPFGLGSRVAIEGYQLESIRPDAVILRSAQGQTLEMKTSGGGP